MGENGGEIWGKVGGGERRAGGNANGHVSMGAQERFGVKDSCIIVASQ